MNVGVVSVSGPGRFTLPQTFFKVGTTFISQNVLRTTLLLSPLKANLSFFKMISLFKVKDACSM
jgi:hypothetical protein